MIEEIVKGLRVWLPVVQNIVFGPIFKYFFNPFFLGRIYNLFFCIEIKSSVTWIVRKYLIETVFNLLKCITKFRCLWY